MARKVKNNRKPWTGEDDATLVQMINAGKNTVQMAKRLGRTRESIYIRKSHLKSLGMLSQWEHPELPVVLKPKVETAAPVQETAVLKPKVETAPIEKSSELLEIFTAAARSAKMVSTKNTVIIGDIRIEFLA